MSETQIVYKGLMPVIPSILILLVSSLVNVDILTAFGFSPRYIVETGWTVAFFSAVFFLFHPLPSLLRQSILSLLTYFLLAQAVVRAVWLYCTGSPLDLLWIANSWYDSAETLWSNVTAYPFGIIFVPLTLLVVFAFTWKATGVISAEVRWKYLYLYLLPGLGLLALTLPYYPPFTPETVVGAVKEYYAAKINRSVFPIAYITPPTISGAKAGGKVLVILLESVSSVPMGYIPGNVNGQLPFMEKYARDGIYFPFLVTGNVQSNRVLLSTLCASANEFGIAKSYLTSDSDEENRNCIPKLLRQSRPGFRSVYLQGFADVTFMSYHQFLPWMGFDRYAVPTNRGDRDWGIPDNITYQLVEQTLSATEGAPDLTVVHMDEGHMPFTSPREESPGSPEYLDNSSTFEQRYKPAQRIQDRELGKFLDWYMSHRPNDLSVVILGDNAWPLSTFHPNNSFNERNAYNENFMVPALVIPSVDTSAKYASLTVEQFVGQADVRNTVVELIAGDEQPNSLLRFARKEPVAPLVGGAECEIAVQPFHGGLVALYKGEEKFIYSIRQQTLSRYNLKNDFAEQHPVDRQMSYAEAEKFMRCEKYKQSASFE